MNKNPQYFEGVLQLRNPSQEIIDFTAKEIEKQENVWIAKTKKHKNGLDLYISSNKFLFQIGKRLKQMFPGDLKISKRLFSKDKLTSKDIYRGCILFRYHALEKGDVITLRGEQIKILAIGKNILGKNIEKNRKVRIQFSQLERV